MNMSIPGLSRKKDEFQKENNEIRTTPQAGTQRINLSKTNPLMTDFKLGKNSPSQALITIKKPAESNKQNKYVDQSQKPMANTHIDSGKYLVRVKEEESAYPYVPLTSSTSTYRPLNVQTSVQPGFSVYSNYAEFVAQGIPPASARQADRGSADSSSARMTAGYSYVNTASKPQIVSSQPANLPLNQGVQILSRDSSLASLHGSRGVNVLADVRPLSRDQSLSKFSQVQYGSSVAKLPEHVSHMPKDEYYDVLQELKTNILMNRDVEALEVLKEFVRRKTNPQPSATINNSGVFKTSDDYKHSQYTPIYTTTQYLPRSTSCQSMQQPTNNIPAASNCTLMSHRVMEKSQSPPPIIFRQENFMPSRPPPAFFGHHQTQGTINKIQMIDKKDFSQSNQMKMVQNPIIITSQRCSENKSSTINRPVESNLNLEPKTYIQEKCKPDVQLLTKIKEPKIENVIIRYDQPSVVKIDYSPDMKVEMPVDDKICETGYQRCSVDDRSSTEFREVEIKLTSIQGQSQNSPIYSPSIGKSQINLEDNKPASTIQSEKDSTKLDGVDFITAKTLKQRLESAKTKDEKAETVKMVDDLTFTEQTEEAIQWTDQFNTLQSRDDAMHSYTDINSKDKFRTESKSVINEEDFSKRVEIYEKKIMELAAQNEKYKQGYTLTLLYEQVNKDLQARMKFMEFELEQQAEK